MTICYKKFKTVTVLTFIVHITIGKFPIIFQFFLIQAKTIPFYFHSKFGASKTPVSYLKAIEFLYSKSVI